LTNDPSITAWGYAVIRNDQIITCGCIKTKPDNKKKRIRKSDDTIRRISEINKLLLTAITDYDVDYILSEAPHGSQNANAAVMIGMVTGMLQTVADCKNIPIEWYSEGDSKKVLLGKISASKEETINAIKKHYIVPWTKVKYYNEAVADAISIYHAAITLSPTLKLLK
jgi:Holliday junction resolvasome RuvABC endonuclease subunit